jgi:secreted trypsin-like serine protease
MKREEIENTSTDKKCICLLISLGILVFILVIVLVTVVVMNLLTIELLIFDETYIKSNTIIKTTTSSTSTTQAITTTPIEFDDFETTCGIAHYESDVIKNYRLHKRIINGKEAVQHSYPWVVSLYELNNGTISSHFCAGTLITPQHVLTAAHCVIRYTIGTRKERSDMNDKQYETYLSVMKAKSILVVVGLHGHDKADKAENFYNIENFTFHQDFSMSPKCCQDDISILRLERPVRISNKVNIICLPFMLRNLKGRVELADDENIIAAGWGLTKAGNKHANSLKQAVMRIKNDDGLCGASQYWQSRSVYCHIDDVGNRTGICNADSGGPVMFYYMQRWYIMGVLSHFAVDSKNGFSHECLPHNPSFSVKVDVYAEWIKDNLY